MSVVNSLYWVKKPNIQLAINPMCYFPIARAQSREKYAQVSKVCNLAVKIAARFRNFLVECSRYSTGCYWQNYTASFFTGLN